MDLGAFRVFPHLTDRLREIHLKASTVLLSSRNCLPPDIVGIVTRAQTSVAGIKARDTVAGLGEVLSSDTKSGISADGIVSYSKLVTALDTKFLEQIREEICTGLDAFNSLHLQNIKPNSQKQVEPLLYFS